MFVVGIAGLLFLAKEPRWIKEKKKEIKNREEDLITAKKNADNVEKTYGEVKTEHDEEIQNAEAIPGGSSFTNADDAASFIGDILRKNKGK